MNKDYSTSSTSDCSDFDENSEKTKNRDELQFVSILLCKQKPVAFVLEEFPSTLRTNVPIKF